MAMAAASDPEDPVGAALVELITSFNDLNSATVQELDQEPSPLEFMRFVSRNTPFVVRHGAANWTAVQQWSPVSLKSALSGQTVNVAVTPHGNADAPTYSTKHDAKLIAKPCEEEQPFGEFLDYLIRQEIDPTFPEDAETDINSIASENDNFRNEYLSLFPDAQKDIPFARIALEKDPDAINLWLGNSKSVTCLHRDPMENIYVQVIGQKHFVLLPPLCHPCVNEQLLPPATYKRSKEGLELCPDPDAELVPLATWDPEDPTKCTTEYSKLARPLHVTLNPGDMLYLPAMWYHKVKQSSLQEGCVVAINYWFDMEFEGSFYPSTSFIRNIGLGTPGKSV